MDDYFVRSQPIVLKWSEDYNSLRSLSLSPRKKIFVGIYSALSLLTRYLLSLLTRYRLRKLYKLRGAFKSESCLIIGSGSSADYLNCANLKSIHQKENLTLIATNLDTLQKTDGHRGKVILVLSDAKTHPETELGDLILEKARSVGAQIFIPIHWNSRLEKQELVFFEYQDEPNLLGKRRLGNPTKFRRFAAKTGVKAISIAIFLGFDKIHISGLDNDYVVASLLEKKNKDGIGLLQDAQECIHELADFTTLFPKSRIKQLGKKGLLSDIAGLDLCEISEL